MQNQEIELAIVGSGELRLKEKFKSLEVSPEKWGKMREDQRKRALEKVHGVPLDQLSTPAVENITKFLGTSVEPTVSEMINAGVDWIPKELLSTMVNKAMSLASEGGKVITQGNDTYVVPSHSNARKPHIVNVYPNGKVECDDHCPGYSSKKICKHTIAVSLTCKRMDQHLRWFVNTQRRTGGINFSKAITHGMPQGRGKKGNQAPRKRSRKTAETTAMIAAPLVEMEATATVAESMADIIRQPIRSTLTSESVYPQVPSTSITPNERRQHSMPVQQVQNNTLPQFNQFIALNRPESCPNAISPSATPIMFRSQCTTLAPQLQSNMLPPTPISCPSTHTLSTQNVGFPNPYPGQFMIYLLQFCPAQTSMCFGCGNPLKQTDGITAPPNDLVVVSRMLREWTFQGQARSKLGNVYFHCNTDCIRRKQREFVAGSLSPINPNIQAHLQLLHYRHLRETFGM